MKVITRKGEIMNKIDDNTFFLMKNNLQSRKSSSHRWGSICQVKLIETILLNKLISVLFKVSVVVEDHVVKEICKFN